MFKEVDDLSQTIRGEGGFGSNGKELRKRVIRKGNQDV